MIDCDFLVTQKPFLSKKGRPSIIGMFAKWSNRNGELELISFVTDVRNVGNPIESSRDKFVFDVIDRLIDLGPQVDVVISSEKWPAAHLRRAVYEASSIIARIGRRGVANCILCSPKIKDSIEQLSEEYANTFPIKIFAYDHPGLSDKIIVLYRAKKKTPFLFDLHDDPASLNSFDQRHELPDSLNMDGAPILTIEEKGDKILWTSSFEDIADRYIRVLKLI